MTPVPAGGAPTHDTILGGVSTVSTAVPALTQPVPLAPVPGPVIRAHSSSACSCSSIVDQTPTVTVCGQATTNSAPTAPVSSGSGEVVSAANATDWLLLAAGGSAATRLLARPSATGSDEFAAGAYAAPNTRAALPAALNKSCVAVLHDPCTVAAGVTSDAAPVSNCSSPTFVHFRLCPLLTLSTSHSSRAVGRPAVGVT